MKTPTKGQAEVYSILSDMFVKALFAIVAIGSFVFVLAKLLKMNCPDWNSAGPYVVIEAMLTMSVAVAFRHYFPSRTKRDSA